MNIRASDISREPRHEQAAAWFMALHDDELSDDTIQGWQQWMLVEANRKAYDEVERLWHRVGDLAPMPMPFPPAEAAPLYDGSVTVRTHVRANRVKPKKTIGRRVADYAAAYGVAAAFAAIGVAALLALAFYRHSDPHAAIAVFETAVGQHQEIVLSDGSHVQLGARSSITASVNANERTVVLDRGEALFKVAHDPKRPFRVLAGGGAITAVGTAFNVRRLDSSVVVTVTEGTISVEPRLGAPATTTAADFDREQVTRGQEISYGGPEGSSSIRTVNPDVATVWRIGRLEYSSEPLNRVVQDVNRYSTRAIAIGDEAAGNIMYSGTVFERDIDDWLAALDKLFPEVEVAQPDDQHVIIRSRVARL